MAMDADALRGKLSKTLADRDGDPLFNAVRNVASQLFQDLERGALSLDDIKAMVGEISVCSFEQRVERFHERHRQMKDRPGALVEHETFDEFQHAVERTRVGIVFTAHPTFALGREKRQLAAHYPTDGDAKALNAWREKLAKAQMYPSDEITLKYEHDEVRQAIENAQNAIGEINRSILECAAERFADDWRALVPNPISLATWVGYDLDGRTDIHWGETIRIRLAEKAAQLCRYVKTLEKIAKKSGNGRLSPILEQLKGAAELTRQQANLFACDLHDPEVVVAAANSVTIDAPGRLTSLSPIIETLSVIIAEEANNETALDLSLLRAEMNACGLGVARIHLRVNAAQVRSALRTDLGLDPDSEFEGRSALQLASQKAQDAHKRSINFGSVFLEQMTARRQFMLCAQILKHIDAETPIRFLIAECEAPATVMGAVYLARLYGVDHKIDISPLFETPQALERGGRFLERLLDNEGYRDYVTARKRMSIQIGFSDSGRFMGQGAAAMAAERLQVLFARALDAAKLPGVEALIFNTHGESMGRGAHPGSFEERINHLITPWVKSRFKKAGIPLNCEFSFQGGEGFLHFQTPELSASTVGTIWRRFCRVPPPDMSDKYYSDINFSWDFYRGLKAWQEDLYDREDYRRVLFSFPQSLLFKTGSRKVKRPQAGAGAPEIRSVRAIPHNAMLQQLAIPANVSGGVGIASGREMDRFIEHVSASTRMRELLHMTFHARSMTSITILRAYAGVYSPSYWSALAGLARQTERSDRYEAVLQALQLRDVGSAFDKLADFLARDLRISDAAHEVLLKQGLAFKESAQNIDFSAIHALRQALIARAASLVAGAPDFSRRHDLDKSDLIDLTLRLQLDEVCEALRRIFPKNSPAENLMAGLSEDGGGIELHGGAYPEVHENIIEPLSEIAHMMREISASVSNYYGAFG